MADLFDGVQTLEELAHHIERSAEKHCKNFNISFGIFRSANSHTKHNAMVACTCKENEKHYTAVLHADTIKDMFIQMDQFFNKLKS